MLIEGWRCEKCGWVCSARARKVCGGEHAKDTDTMVTQWYCCPQCDAPLPDKPLSQEEVDATWAKVDKILGAI
jgi:hypothetical protein